MTESFCALKVAARGHERRMTEKETILSDDLVCKVITAEAERVGVTPEDYVDRFLDIFYNSPQKLPKLDFQTVV